MSDNGSQPSSGPLPPPAFPPGSKRRAAAPATMPQGGEGVPADAFFSPDDPIERSGTRMPDDAFFSPDEPVVREAPPTVPDDYAEVVGTGGEDEGPDEVVVTGMGLDSHVRTAGSSRFDDPYVEDLYTRLATLTKSLKDKGEAGLRTTSEMSRFDATLRGYCVGYLAGLREHVGAD